MLLSCRKTLDIEYDRSDDLFPIDALGGYYIFSCIISQISTLRISDPKHLALLIKTVMIVSEICFKKDYEEIQRTEGNFYFQSTSIVKTIKPKVYLLLFLMTKQEPDFPWMVLSFIDPCSSLVSHTILPSVSHLSVSMIAII